MISAAARSIKGTMTGKKLSVKGCSCIGGKLNLSLNTTAGAVL